MKKSWLSDRDQLSRDAPIISDADLEDAMEYGGESMPQETTDDLMMDDGPPDDDLDAMLASYEQDVPRSQRPPSLHFSDDDEYDDIFADLMSQQPSHPSHEASQPDPSDAMQLSQDMAY